MSMTELDIVIANFFGEIRLGRTRKLKHFIGHIDTDDSPFWAHNLGGDKANFATTGSKVEHRFAFFDVARGVTASIVAVEHFLRNDFQEFRVVINGAAKRLFDGLCGGTVAF